MENSNKKNQKKQGLTELRNQQGDKVDRNTNTSERQVVPPVQNWAQV